MLKDLDINHQISSQENSLNQNFHDETVSVPTNQSGLPDLGGSVDDNDIQMPWHNLIQDSPDPRHWPDNDYFNHLTFIQVVEEFNELILNANNNYYRNEIENRMRLTEELLFDEFDGAIDNIEKKI